MSDGCVIYIGTAVFSFLEIQLPATVSPPGFRIYVRLVKARKPHFQGGDKPYNGHASKGSSARSKHGTFYGRERYAMNCKYNARVNILKSNESVLWVKEEHTFRTAVGFDTVKEATSWLGSEMAELMTKWFEIDENGITIVGEVYDEDDAEFLDLYELKCGF